MALLVSTFTFAYDIQVDGIYYYVNASDLTCKVTSNGNNSYSGDINIPETINFKNKTLKVIGIGYEAFYNCTDLTSITIGESVVNIEERAFYGCSSLSSLTIPSSVKRIDNYAFSGCSSLKELIIEDGESTLSLGNCTFSHTFDGWTTSYYCGLFYSSPIEKIYLGRNIDSAPFYNNLNRDGNKHIKEVIIGNNVTNIGSFYGCSGLECVVMGNNVNNIESGAFSDCKNLKTIFYTSAIPPKSLWIVTNTYVPNIDAYSKSQILSGNAIFLEEYVTFGTNSSTYGTPIHFTWSSNIDSTEYKATASEVELRQNAGTYTTDIPFTFTKGENKIYVNIPYTYTISKAPLTVKTDSLSRLYGDENPEFALSYSGFVNGENESVLSNKGTATTSATAESNAGEYPITISGVTANNYDAQYEAGVLYIKKAPLSVTANNATKIYGDNNPTISLSYSGLKNNEASPEMISSFNISTDATKTSNVGEYDIAVSGGEAKNYEVTNYTNGKLTIAKAPIKITVNDTTKIYGDDNPIFEFSCSGLKNNDTTSSIFSTFPVLTCTATKDSSTGNYDIIASEGEAQNYEIVSYTNGTLTVAKAPLTITAHNYTKLYGDKNPTFEYTCSGFKNSDNSNEIFETKPQVICNATEKSSVGEYEINIIGGNAKNYEIANITKGILTIDKAQITVIANNSTRVYGDDNPEYTLAYSGLKNGETSPEMISSFNISTDAIKTSNVGEYDITVSDGEAKNYEIVNYVSGKLVVTKAPLTVIAKNFTKIYGDKNPEFQYSYYGTKNNDEENNIFETLPNISCIANETSNAGEYDIEIGDAFSNNYEITYKYGILSINKREITVSTNNYTRVYGKENPDFEIFYNGFVNNEDESVFLIKPKAKTNAEKYSDVGVYEINIEGGDDENYSFAYNNSTLTIEKADQSIIWEQEFNDLTVGSQIELTAKASSGLNVEYIIPNNNFISVYTIGDKTYLDCYDAGEIVVRASQDGNINYNAAIRVSKIIKVTPTNISSVSEDAKVNIDGNNITIVGANNNAVKIFNFAGMLVKSYERYSGEKIELDNNTYIIRIGAKAIKIRL